MYTRNILLVVKVCSGNHVTTCDEKHQRCTVSAKPAHPVRKHVSCSPVHSSCSVFRHILPSTRGFPCRHPTATCHPQRPCVQGDTSLEKQISRWRQEVFKLLLTHKQAQQAHQQQADAQAQDIGMLRQQVSAGEDKAALLDSRLLDRCVDLDLTKMQARRTEEQLQQSGR